MGSIFNNAHKETEEIIKRLSGFLTFLMKCLIEDGLTIKEEGNNIQTVNGHNFPSMFVNWVYNSSHREARFNSNDYSLVSEFLDVHWTILNKPKEEEKPSAPLIDYLKTGSVWSNLQSYNQKQQALKDNYYTSYITYGTGGTTTNGG